VNEASIDVDRFRTLVEQRLGLNLEEQPDHLARFVRQRMRAIGCATFRSYDVFLSTSADAQAEFRAIAEGLTVGETYFFRNNDHFRALVDHALPERLRKGAAGARLRVLSVGCASGEEPYTIAILVREHFGHLGAAGVALRGIDVNPAAIARAERARYTSWSLRETPSPIREKYFRPVDDGQVLLDGDIRAMVAFEERNLFDDDARFWAPSSFDIVFCRNVVIYFRSERVSESVEKLAHVLVPGGFLFLGHSESLRGMTDDFDLQNTHDTFYYRKRDPSDPKPANAAGSSWTAPIQRASMRVEQLTSRPPGPPLPAPDMASDRETNLSLAHVDLATDLYRQERIVDALEVLGGLPTASERLPEVLILRAALLTNQGLLDEAEAMCDRIFAVGGPNAGAHYLMALIREKSGDLDGALRHDQMAAYADPTFSMPRLHMGRLARQSGDRTTARRELSQAMTLLAREEGGRIVLFGGGFSREALTRLCRTELLAAGDRP
jgi:chemotaxis protein methyltransferase CheR